MESPGPSPYSRPQAVGFSAGFISERDRLQGRVRTLERRLARLTIERDCISRQLEAERISRREADQLQSQVAQLENERDDAFALCLAALERESMAFLRGRARQNASEYTADSTST